jgi:diadenosine tetraphosphatase ApaH/serine/threonine PP2A family protein phosphatase
MCVHGGLSPSVPLIDTIATINRVQEIPEAGPLGDLVWSDPDNTMTAWTVSNRGAGYLFPHQAAKEFLHINDLVTIARAHQLVEQGHTFNFGDQSVVTVWSAPNYCYRCGNKAAVMKVSENGTVEFITFAASDENIKYNISY